MTTLELILTIIIYNIVGLWICYKRNWYAKNYENQSIIIVLAIVFTPLNLILTILSEYFLSDWKN